MSNDPKVGFNFQQWTKNTVLTMSSVPWNSDYRDIVRMDSLAEVDAWIDERPNVTIERFSLAKFNQDVKVDIPFNRAMNYNYLRAVNDTPEEDSPRAYYYFILEPIYVSPKHTRLKLQLDVWTTYGYDIQFGESYLERGHMSIANTAQFDQYGRSYLTVPEGMDVGAEYRIVHKEHTRILDVSGLVNADPGYDVLVCSTLDLTQDPGTLSNPALATGTGGNWNGLPSGADFYIFPTGQDLQKWMTAYSAKPWITQSIISITLIPNMNRYHPGYDYGTNLGTSDFKFYRATSPFFSEPPLPKSSNNLANWRNNDFISNILGESFKKLKKFLTYPFMVIELTSFNGSPVLLRPESWQDANAKVTELAAFMPPGQRIAIYPARYNADAETLSATQTDNVEIHGGGTLIDDNGDALDIAVTLDNFPQLPIVNNMGIAYLAQNRNGIAFSFANAGWGRERGIAAGQLGADVANAQIANTNTQAGIGINATLAGAALNQQMSWERGIVGVASGALSGSPGSMIGATADAMLNSQQGNAQAAIQANARAASAGSDISTAVSVRDSNQGFANFAAQGDYENNIRGIGARIQDAALTQPSVSGQFGGDAFNLVQGLFGYALIWKMMNLNALRTIGTHWLRYGYAVHQFVTPPANMRCMEKFTYWKMSQTYVVQGFIPEAFKQVIRGIFEKGVTVWSSPDYIGTTALDDNDPLPGISY